MVQKIGSRLLLGEKNLLFYSGKELLIKTVLTAMPTHFITMYKLSAWACKEIDHYRTSFLSLLEN
jgi:hypothetical protein